MLIDYNKFTILLEKNILTIKNPRVSIQIDVESTKHSTERQARHKEEDIYITDKEIVSTMKKAIPKIANELIVNKIDVGNSICIKHNSLNIITALILKGNNLLLKLITVMKKDNFKAKRGTYTLSI